MNLNTRVFERVINEREEAAVKCLVEVMAQTPRFGCFTKEYLEGVARKFYNETLQKKRGRTTRWVRKRVTSEC